MTGFAKIGLVCAVASSFVLLGGNITKVLSAQEFSMTSGIDFDDSEPGVLYVTFRGDASESADWDTEEDLGSLYYHEGHVAESPSYSYQTSVDCWDMSLGVHANFYVHATGDSGDASAWHDGDGYCQKPS